MVTSPLPAETRHDYVADPTIADALLDRVVHNARRLERKGAVSQEIGELPANLEQRHRDTSLRSDR
jgi:hypothetical protein